MKTIPIGIYYEGYKDVVVETHINQLWTPQSDLEEEIEAIWTKKIETNPTTFNGDMVRVINSRLEDDVVVLNTELTNYKQFIGTINQQSMDRRANPLYVCANVITKDRKYVFGLRANCMRGNKQYNISSGSVDINTDFEHGLPSCDKAILRETYEEFCISPKQIKSKDHFMYYHLPNELTGTFLYEINLNVSSTKMKQIFDKTIKQEIRAGLRNEDDLEFTELKFVDSDLDSLQTELELDCYRPHVVGLLTELYRRKVNFKHITSCFFGL